MQEPQDIFYNKRALSLLRTLFTIPRPYASRLRLVRKFLLDESDSKMNLGTMINYDMALPFLAAFFEIHA